MKKILALLLMLSMVISCSYVRSGTSVRPRSQTEQLCVDLKRDIIFSKTSGLEIGTASATEQAQTFQLYDKYGCSSLEQNASAAK